MTNEFKFNLGQTVKHIYLEIEGRIVARSQYITNCNRYALQMKQLDKDGRPQEWLHFDEDELLAVDEEEAEQSESGGPMPDIPPRGS